MNRLSLLILLAGCDSAVVGGSPDAATPSFDPGSVTGTPQPEPSPPDFVCLSHVPPTTAPDPLSVAGTVLAMTNGSLVPVPAVELQVFRDGQPVVLGTTTTDAAGVFSIGSVASGGHPLRAYLKATKLGFRTTFLYPPFPMSASATAVPLPTITDAAFATLASSFGVAQDDRKNGVLLVAVADCKGNPVAGATLQISHGSSPAGTIHDLGGGQYIVFDVPDGKTHVSATYNGIQLPEHDVKVRAQDPDCTSPRSTLTATTVIPAP